MKQVEMLAYVSKGVPLCVVEYRSTKAQVINYRDKQSQKIVSMPICEHGIEVGGVQVRLSERLPDGADVTQIKPPFSKGASCVLFIESWVTEKGSTRAQGKLYALES